MQFISTINHLSDNAKSLLTLHFESMDTSQLTSKCDLYWENRHYSDLSAVRNPNWVQCSEQLTFPLNWMSICVLESQHHALWNSTWHLSDREMAVLCFQFPCSIRAALFLFLTAERRITGFPSSHISLSFSLSLVLFPHFCSLFYTLTSFSFPLLLCLISYLFPSLPFVSFCFLLPLGFSTWLSVQLLWDCPWSFDMNISSIHCCPVFPSSRPCNIKVKGDIPCCFQWVLIRGREEKKTENSRGESDVTHSRAGKMNALWLNLPFSHLLLFTKSGPCSTAALKLWGVHL